MPLPWPASWWGSLDSVVRGLVMTAMKPAKMLMGIDEISNSVFGSRSQAKHTVKDHGLGTVQQSCVSDSTPRALSPCESIAGAVTR